MYTLLGEVDHRVRQDGLTDCTYVTSGAHGLLQGPPVALVARYNSYKGHVLTCVGCTSRHGARGYLVSGVHVIISWWPIQSP